MSALFKNLEPIRVSPLIKGIRWTFLIIGIVYGAVRQKQLAIREVDIRKEEEKQRKIREAKIKEEKDRQSERDIEMLTEIFLGTSSKTETEPKK